MKTAISIPDKIFESTEKVAKRLGVSRSELYVNAISNVFLAGAPVNVRLSTKACGLDKESVVNVSQVVTLDKSYLTEKAGKLSTKILQDVDDGLRLVLGL